MISSVLFQIRPWSGGLLIIALMTTLHFACGSNSQSKRDECKLKSSYSSSDGYQSMEVTIIGSAWFGQLKDLTTGSVLSSSQGRVEGDKLLGDYDTEIGYLDHNCNLEVSTG
jgi:hypothetical protein